MRCLNCGREITDDSNFCEYCGAAVTQGNKSTVNSLDMLIARLIKEGRKLEAVKAYCTTYHVGLREAKDAVDMMELQIRNSLL